MYSVVTRSRSPQFPTLFDDPFFDALNETFKVFTNDLFSDKSKVSDVFKNQVKYPKTDIIETSSGLRFEMAVPGCKKEDIEVSLENGILAVKYDETTKKESSTYAYNSSAEPVGYVPGIPGGIEPGKYVPIKNDGKMLLNELRHSSFRRAWTLGAEIKEEDIKASMEDGILKIFVPFKVPEAAMVKSKKIAVA
jgi:HSP20 family protein